MRGQAKKRKLGSSFTVDIAVGGVDCTILCPAKRLKAADLMCKLDSRMLAAVFDYIKEDCGQCGPSRPYQRTGKFKKDREDDNKEGDT